MNANVLQIAARHAMAVLAGPGYDGRVEGAGVHAILFLSANAEGLAHLGVDDEYRVVEDALQRGSQRERFELVPCPAATPDDLIEKVRRVRPTILHFSGHGGERPGSNSPIGPVRDFTSAEQAQDAAAGPGLFLRDSGDGAARFVSGVAVAKAIGSTRVPIKLAVLSACYSDAQADVLLQHVDCVVGMAGPILDRAAIKFARGFYGALADGESVAAAYEQGCAAIGAHDIPGERRPTLKPRDHIDPERIFLGEPSTQPQTPLDKYRAEVVQRAKKRYEWLDLPISLNAISNHDRREHDAMCELKGWLSSKEDRHCVVIGEPGCGKSGLLWGVARILAATDQAIPILVSASILLKSAPASFEELTRTADVALPLSIEDIDPDTTPFLLLDGLDELIRLGGDATKVAQDILIQTLRLVPPGCRILASCRVVPFGVLESVFHANLPAAARSRDPYDDILDSVLPSVRDLRIMQVQPVPADAAMAALRRSKVPEDLIAVALSSPLSQQLTTPLHIKLVERAIPSLSKLGFIALDELYRSYVRLELKREDHTLTESEIRAIEAALSMYARGRTAMSLEPKLEAAVRNTELLRTDGDGIGFSHYTFWEYFMADGLADEIQRFDSNFLSGIDLVGVYNINRLLVPMLVRKLGKKTERIPPRVRAVTSPEYRDFLQTTRWREESGYGLHPSMVKSHDGTPSASFPIERAFEIHDDRQHGEAIASRLSWYDAMAYALYSGRRLPTIDEVAGLRCDGNYLVWCVGWFREAGSLINVFRLEDRCVVGLNPDIRLPHTALAIVER